MRSSVTVKYFGGIESKTRYEHVNIDKMKRNFLAITANKIDCNGKTDDVTSIPASYKRSSIDGNHKRARKGKGGDENISEIIVLFLCVMDVNIATSKVS